MQIDTKQYIRPISGPLSLVFGNPHRIVSKTLLDYRTYSKLIALERHDHLWDIVLDRISTSVTPNGEEYYCGKRMEILTSSLSKDDALKTINDHNDNVKLAKNIKGQDLTLKL